MSNTPIASREAALRIALAARTLNNLNVRALVEALADKCGLPITEDRLAQLTVEDLRALESHERLRLRRRVTFTPPEGRTPAEQLLVDGSAHGALACGWNLALQGDRTTWSPRTVIDRGHPALADVPDEAIVDGWVFSGPVDAVVGVEGV